MVLPEDFPLGCLDDSKALSELKRGKAYDLIVAGALDWAVAWATHEEIGAFNILNASLLAMSRAYSLIQRKTRIVLVDGDRLPPISDPCHAIVRGDSMIPSIMAASILAKVARDRLMTRLDGIEPEYSFPRHKGYPTKSHLEAIKKNGPSLWARPGFRSSGLTESQSLRS
ncbi:MAG: ribonuclease HII [Spirochaetes bacterium]|nr:MAG: ribonuclease HII [Spirochaetota bacterium]